MSDAGSGFEAGVGAGTEAGVGVGVGVGVRVGVGAETGDDAGVGVTFILASASPARAATLRSAGIDPMIMISDVDEDAVLGNLESQAAKQGLTPTPAEQVRALAKAKAKAVALQILATGHKFPTSRRFLVVGCDSMLEFRGEMLGKPHLPDLAFARIKELQGNDATLWTGHYAILIDWPHISDQSAAAASTVVHFGPMSDPEIAAYVATGEPLEVAGSFTIDGLGGAFLRGVTGDPHSVVGISLPLLRQMTSELGIFWPSLWTGQKA